MTWAHPPLLALLLLVPVALVLAIVGWRARRSALARLAGAGALRSLFPPGVHVARAWQAVLVVIAVGGLAVAAAGPQLGFDWEQRRLEGVSIAVVLDVSRSMDAQDVSPSRMERARRELEDFVGALRGDAIGLVLFADGAWVRIPLTVDYATFLWAVKDSGSDTIRAQGTALTGALEAATTMLARAPGTGKAILVVSDGEVHEKPEAVDAAVAKAKAAGVHIYALGIGEPAGAPIPLAEGGFHKDALGSVVLSKLDEDRLTALAEATGGAYVRAVPSDEDVRVLYESEIRGKLEAAERGIRRDKRPRERYQWPLGAALVTMVVSSALGVRGRRVATLLAVGLLGTMLPQQAWAGAREDGMTAYKAEHWEEAARLLGQARVADPQDVDLTNALATSLYRAGRFREAEQLYETLAAQTGDAGLRAIARYNAGNAAYRGGRLGEAYQDFQDAVKDAPAFTQAKQNAEAVGREIEARLHPQPPQDSGDQGQQGEDGQTDSQQGQQPQDGQQGQKPQDGQQGQQPQDGQHGQQPQDGQQGQQPQDGQQGQQPQDGQQGQQPQQGQAPTPGEEAPGQQGDPSSQDAQAGGSPDDTDPTTLEDGSTAGQAGGANSDDGEEMSAEQAARLVDAVPDGKPAMAVGGTSSREDW